jgi:hypothetical protein
VIVEEEVEIVRSRLFEGFVLSTEKVLDALLPRHLLRRSYALATKLGDLVQEIGFAFDLDRLCLVFPGEFGNREACLHQTSDSKQEVSSAITKIRADAYISCNGFGVQAIK